MCILDVEVAALQDAVCYDSDGNAHEPGETYKDECNTW